ncbi:MAG: recombination regulator RecX, partial [Gammaproteobacteria bacterium]|nr:recombination regulator RecX [Gammaproteobacteria bacterium]
MQPKDIQKSACDLLARREHSKFELRQKFKVRQFDEESIETTLSFLASNGWQSDERFVEALVRERIARGYGPLKILNELH